MAVRAKSVSYVKSHLAQVIEEARGGGGPMLMTQNGATSAVIQDPDSYERTQQALAMFKLIAMAEEDIRKGRIHTHEEVFAAVRKKLAARRKAGA
jgi:prevent-host-death family protein